MTMPPLPPGFLLEQKASIPAIPDSSKYPQLPEGFVMEPQTPAGMPKPPPPNFGAEDKPGLLEGTLGKTGRALTMAAGMAADLPGMFVTNTANAMQSMGRYALEKTVPDLASYMPPQRDVPSISENATKSYDILTGSRYVPQNDFERATEKATAFLASAGGLGALSKLAGAAEAAPTTIAGLLNQMAPRTTADLTAAAGAGAGSEMGGLPGAIGGGIAGALAGKPTQGIINLLTSPRETLTQTFVDKPGNALANMLLNAGEGRFTGMPGISKQMNSDFAKKGNALEESLGIKFTPAELTGNKRAQVIEDYLGNSAITADRVFQNNVTRIDKITDKFTRILDSVYKNETGPLSVGSTIIKAYDGVVKNIREARRSQAILDFSKAHQLSMNQRFVRTDNFVDTLKRFIDEGNSDIATPAARNAAKQAEKMLARLTNKDGTTAQITIKDLQAGLSTYGDGAKASGGIWKDLATANDRRFASEAFGALKRDMDAAIDGATTGNPKAVAALKMARDRYSAFSEKLDKINDTVLGRYLGSEETRSPERIAEALKNLRPTEIQQTLKVLDEYTPTAGNLTRRYMLEQAYNRAIEGKGQRGAGLEDYKFDAARFLAELPDDAKLSAIFGKNKKAISEIKTIAEGLNRIQFLGASKAGSPTASRTEAREFLSGNVLSPKFWLGKSLQLMTGQKMADIMLDPAKRSYLANNLKTPTRNPGAVASFLHAVATSTSQAERNPLPILPKSASNTGQILPSQYQR